MDDERGYLVGGDRRPWPLVILPVLGIALVALILLMAARVIPFLFTNDLDAWALAVTGVLVVFLVLELLFLRRRKPRPSSDAGDAARTPTDEMYAPPAAAPSPPRTAGDVETTVTSEEWSGRKVLAASRPPKSASPGAVYTKTYVPVADDLVLRMEDLVAGPEQK